MLIRAIEATGQSSFRPAQASPSALTILAHDLRGPLTSLRLLVELIGTQSEGAATAKISAYSHRAEQIIDRLDGLLNSTLERVRDAGDPLCPNPKIVDLVDVMDEAIDLNLPQARAKSVSLVAVSQSAVNFLGDRQLLLQVIENIVGNAIKHSCPNQPVICTVKKDEDNAHVSVKDSGAGMTTSDLGRAFGPFATLSATSGDRSRSWGLGLWIAKLIVEQHGGSIHARSDGPGRGSEFGFVLPLNS